MLCTTIVVAFVMDVTVIVLLGLAGLFIGAAEPDNPVIVIGAPATKLAVEVTVNVACVELLMVTDETAVATFGTPTTTVLFGDRLTADG